MAQAKLNRTMNVENADAGWSGMYRAAGVGVLIAVGLMLLDIVLSFAGGDAPTGKLSAVDWFAQFQGNWFLGLRNLGFFNVINPILTLPLYLALVKTHRKHSPSASVLALILLVLGMAVYIANNRALSMLALSSQYAAATEAQRSFIVGAGTVLLAQAEDFTPGTFMGFFLQSFASMLMLIVMLRGKVFSRWIALIGMIGVGCLLIFTVSVTFAPATFDAAMVFALFGGLLMLAWNVLMALGMIRLGRSHSNLAERPVRPDLLNPSGKGI